MMYDDVPVVSSYRASMQHMMSEVRRCRNFYKIRFEGEVVVRGDISKCQKQSLNPVESGTLCRIS